MLWHKQINMSYQKFTNESTIKSFWCVFLVAPTRNTEVKELIQLSKKFENKMDAINWLVSKSDYLCDMFIQTGRQLGFQSSEIPIPEIVIKEVSYDPEVN